MDDETKEAFAFESTKGKLTVEDMIEAIDGLTGTITDLIAAVNSCVLAIAQMKRMLERAGVGQSRIIRPGTG